MTVNNLMEEQKREIVIEEKTKLARTLGKMKSREIDLVAREESPLYRRREVLRTLLEVMVGVYVGIISILIVVVISGMFH